jgi:hypothetical protein
MATTKKKLLIGCSIALGVFLLLIVVGGFVGYRYFISPIISARAMPEALQRTGVLVGEGFLSRSIYMQDTRLGTISDVKFGEFDPSPGPEIAIVGSRGALFVDANANAKSSVMFSVHAGHVEIVDVDGDGISEYLDRGGGWQDVSLIDHKGNAIWTYGGRPGVDNISGGDINRDGILDFVVGFNGGGGVRLLDSKGQEKWKQSGANVWHVELVDVNDDGSVEIVHSNAAGEMVVRDKDGKILHKAKPAPYFSTFSLCRWPTKKARQYALLAENDTIWLFDFFGKSVFQFDAPLAGKLGNARGVPTRIQNKQSEYFAVVVEFSNWNRSILYVYAPDKKLVYQEIIPEACASIASLSLDSKGQETLLVGCNGKVWKYSVKAGATVRR